MLSLSRDNAKLLYGLFGINQANTIKDRVQACLSCHAVSVGDSYWVKRNTEALAWKSINIRINNISSIIDVSLDGQFPSLTTNPEHPDLTTDGLFRKSWIRRDGKLFLIKSDRTNEFINTKMEVLASEIIDCFIGVEHIKYWEKKGKQCREIQSILVSVKIIVQKSYRLFMLLKLWGIANFLVWISSIGL